MSSTFPSCALCGRQRELTFHHLIPRMLHRNKWFRKRYSRDELGKGIDICRDCHGAIHSFATEKELGRKYNSINRLMDHPEIGRFVRWVASRKGTKRHRTRSGRHRRAT